MDNHANQKVENRDHDPSTLASSVPCPPGYVNFFRVGTVPPPPCCPNIPGILFKVEGCVDFDTVTVWGPLGPTVVRVVKDIIVKTVQPATPDTDSCFRLCGPNAAFKVGSEAAIEWLTKALDPPTGPVHGEDMNCISYPELFPRIYTVKTPSCVYAYPDTTRDGKLDNSNFSSCNDLSYCEYADTVTCDVWAQKWVHKRGFVQFVDNGCPDTTESGNQGRGYECLPVNCDP